jgi:hypothetical protein
MRVRAILLLATMVLLGLLLSGVAPALADIVGDNNPNTLMGNEKRNVMYGRDGGDKIYGNTNHDWLYGEQGDDELHGGKGNDTLDGGSGSDRAFGEGGKDGFYEVEATPQSRQGVRQPVQQRPDELNGGPGDDTFVTVDGNPDIITCGTGNDRAWIDRVADEAELDCERVVLCPDGQPGQCPGGAPPQPPPPPQQPDRHSRFSL